MASSRSALVAVLRCWRVSALLSDSRVTLSSSCTIPTISGERLPIENCAFSRRHLGSPSPSTLEEAKLFEPGQTRRRVGKIRLALVIRVVESPFSNPQGSQGWRFAIKTHASLSLKTLDECGWKAFSIRAGNRGGIVSVRAFSAPLQLSRLRNRCAASPSVRKPIGINGHRSTRSAESVEPLSMMASMASIA